MTTSLPRHPSRIEEHLDDLIIELDDAMLELKRKETIKKVVLGSVHKGVTIFKQTSSLVVGVLNVDP